MKKIKMVIPKGRMYPNISRLLNDSGITLEVNDRHYIPKIGDPNIEAKIIKPQNIAQVIELGSHDVGFVGYDWIKETGAQVTEIMDLKMDPVKIVVAVSSQLKEKDFKKKKFTVASEYENISRKFLSKNNYDYRLIRTYGATEAFPPQDADMIIDNSASGQTLREHNLKVVAQIMDSSTRFIANKNSLKDSWKREKIEELQMLFKAVMNARGRVMLEMNVPSEKLEEVVEILPCMRAPTVSPLYKEMGYAVKVAVRKKDTVRLIPLLKKIGATDVLEYELKKVIT